MLIKCNLLHNLIFRQTSKHTQTILTRMLPCKNSKSKMSEKGKVDVKNRRALSDSFLAWKNNELSFSEYQCHKYRDRHQFKFRFGTSGIPQVKPSDVQNRSIRDTGQGLRWPRTTHQGCQKGESCACHCPTAAHHWGLQQFGRANPAKDILAVSLWL